MPTDCALNFKMFPNDVLVGGIIKYLNERCLFMYFFSDSIIGNSLHSISLPIDKFLRGSGH